MQTDKYTSDESALINSLKTNYSEIKPESMSCLNNSVVIDVTIQTSRF